MRLNGKINAQKYNKNHILALTAKDVLLTGCRGASPYHKTKKRNNALKKQDKQSTAKARLGMHWAKRAPLLMGTPKRHPYQFNEN